MPPRTRSSRRTTAWLLALTMVLGLVGSLPATAHTGSQTINLFSPISDGDSVYTDHTADWAVFSGTQPSVHHIVYSNWGFKNDWSVDIYAPAGRRVVSPFGTKASNGNAIEVKVVGRAAGCASGLIADGGYRITLEAKDKVTGDVIGRADLMHVDNPQVSVGTVVGPWTTLGYLKQFRYNSCYQVTSAAGVHLHFEVINKHNYACYVPRSSGGDLTELTVIGKVGTHGKAGQRATC